MTTLVDTSNVTNIWLRIDEIAVWAWLSTVKLAIRVEYSLPPSYIFSNSVSSYFWVKNMTHVKSFEKHEENVQREWIITNLIEVAGEGMADRLCISKINSIVQTV